MLTTTTSEVPDTHKETSSMQSKVPCKSSIRAATACTCSSSVPSSPVTESADNTSDRKGATGGRGASTLAAPSSNTFTALVSSLRSIFGPYGIQDKDNVDVKAVISAMESYISDPAHWSHLVVKDSHRYTRTLVDDGNGKFNLLLLTWPPDVKSPIHDHSGAHCVMKVLQGQLGEKLYEWPEGMVEKGPEANRAFCGAETEKNGALCDKQMSCKREATLKENEVGYINDTIGLHRIENSAPDSYSVSLHIYSPPFKLCKTFCEKTSKARAQGCMVFQNVNGAAMKEMSCEEQDIGRK